MQVAETATQFFISGDRPNVAGLVLAGSADVKNELNGSDLFDQRLGAVVLAVVDVSYGAFLPQALLERLRLGKTQGLRLSLALFAVGMRPGSVLQLSQSIPGCTVPCLTQPELMDET